jgi:hypothetical protein
MRLAGLLAAVLASLATLPADSAALDQQLEQLPLLLSCSPPLERDPPPIGTTTSTLIDVLSADADYSTLLRLLQRTQLVPALNALANGTLLAPTNAAFEAAGYPGGPSQGSLADWAWSPFDSLEQDNLLRATRDRLLYHVLNHSLPLDPLEAERPPGNDSAKPQSRPSPPPPEEVACRPRFPPVGGLPESLETTGRRSPDRGCLRRTASSAARASECAASGGRAKARSSASLTRRRATTGSGSTAGVEAACGSPRGPSSPATVSSSRSTACSTSLRTSVRAQPSSCAAQYRR